MIAARFRLVGWTAGVAGAALLCYLASQSVAAERAGLAQVDRQLADTRADVARLETEIAARSRMGQIERWNTDVLALQAPAPRQYVASEVQLASLAGGKPLPIDPAVAASRGAVATVAYVPGAAAARPAAPRPTPAVAAPPQAPAPEPLLRVATYVRPKVSRLAGEAPVVKVAYARPVEVAPPTSLLPADFGALVAAENRPAKARAAAVPVKSGPVKSGPGGPKPADR